MSLFLKSISFVLVFTLIAFYSCLLIVFTSQLLEEPKPVLVTDYQLEEMQRLKEYCEAENPNKECVLMFDYWAVKK